MKIEMLLGIIALALVLMVLIAELGLRIGFGFGNPPLYIGDDRIGYLLAPNQRVRRYGNLIRINEYSMRADAIAPLPNPHTLRILLLGDSLANGSWWTDQSNILSVRIAQQLQTGLSADRPANLLADYQQTEALNVSANSWGPRNQKAYLDSYGTFGATVIVLLLNTDDLFGTQPTPLQVGRSNSYPDRKPVSAIAEVLSRYAKAKPIPGLKEIEAEGGDRVGKNLAAIDGIYKKAITDGSQFLLVLSPLKRELPGPRDYELVARQRLSDWAVAANVTYLDLLKPYQQQPDPSSLYRDHIHLSPVGDAFVAGAIAQAIPALLAI